VSAAPPRALCSDLALALRAELIGELGAHHGRDHVSADGGRGEGGDVTFAIDTSVPSR
jgi:hypothetical protein